MESKNIAIVMAGGSGAKLWPKSTSENAKQFVDFFNMGSMLQSTYKRLSNYFEKENILVATYHSQARSVKEQLPELSDENLILEPFGRNTSACLGLCGVDLFHRYNNEDVIFAFPADHLIQNEKGFYHSLELARNEALQNNSIVTIGINPVRASQRYGYIQINDTQSEIKKVLTFAEKPDKDTAARFVDSGDFLWNSGIFVWKLYNFFKQFDTYLPELSTQFKSLRKHWNTHNYKENIEFVFKQINAVSLDYGILEKAQNVSCIEGNFVWSDIGTWDEIFRLSDRDENNNTINGNVIALNTSNSLIDVKDKLVGIVGIDDLVVVESDEALLICKRGETEDVKEIIDHLRRRELDKLV